MLQLIKKAATNHAPQQTHRILLGCAIIASFTLLFSLGIAIHQHEPFWNNGTLASAAALALIGGAYFQTH